MLRAINVHKSVYKFKLIIMATDVKENKVLKHALREL